MPTDQMPAASQAVPATGHKPAGHRAAPRMPTVRRVVDITGRVLIGAGVVLLLFTAYQIWGTSIQESHTQAGLRSTLVQESNSAQVRKALEDAATLDKLPTGPPIAATRTADPVEGEPVGDIRIPVIGINQVIVEGTNTPDLRKGPGHYIGTPLPGQGGNAAVAGHRTTYGHPFYNLDAVKVGDPIVVTTLQGIFVYDAYHTQVVSPTDTDVIRNAYANLLTLTTCNPRFSASTRLIVQARLAHSQLFPNTLHSVTLPRFHGQSNDLAGDNSVQLTDALFWGFVVLLVGAGILYLGHRFRDRRWAIWVVGTAGVLVLLWFFFGAVSPLLPASF
jgi:sortase A